MQQRSQVTKAGGGEDGPEHRAGESERQQQRRLVGEDRVLDHVAEDELVSELVHRADGRREQQDEPATEAELAKRRWRAVVLAQVGDAAEVRDGERRREQQCDHGGHERHSPVA